MNRRSFLTSLASIGAALVAGAKLKGIAGDSPAPKPSIGHTHNIEGRYAKSPGRTFLWFHERGAEEITQSALGAKHGTGGKQSEHYYLMRDAELVVASHGGLFRVIKDREFCIHQNVSRDFFHQRARALGGQWVTEVKDDLIRWTQLDRAGPFTLSHVAGDMRFHQQSELAQADVLKRMKAALKRDSFKV